jgi:hypothetical protein
VCEALRLGNAQARVRADSLDEGFYDGRLADT